MTDEARPDKEPRETQARPLDVSELNARQSTLGDLFAFLWEHKKLWMVPVLVVLLVLALVLTLGSTAFAPFIYTLF